MMPLWIGLALMSVQSGDSETLAHAYNNPETVEISGYVGHAMEPFLSRDGEWLFFNNRNQPGDQTDLFYARRVTDIRFEFVGSLTEANSTDLDGVASMDADNHFYFVSPRNYEETRNTLWQGHFADGAIEDVEPVRGDVSKGKALWLNMDAEISADGRTLYFTDNRWRLFGGGIKSSTLEAARRMEDGRFERLTQNPFINLNSDKLEFAPATTADELTVYFTRVDTRALKQGDESGFGLFVATRPSRAEPFGAPSRIQSIKGYVEGPTVSPDGCAIYFHQRVGEIFKIRRAERRACSMQTD